MALLSTTTFQEMQPKELDLFTIPHTQTAVEEIFYQDCRSISQVSGQSPIEFHLSGQNGMEYLDLSRSRLYVRCKIRASDGSDLIADEKVGPINLFLQSLWSQIDVTLQGKLITSTNNHYPYKAMMQTLLNYGDDCKQTQLTSQLFSKDTPGSMEETNPNGANSGFYERSTFTNQSKSVDMEGTLFQDIFKINRYILNQVDVGLKLYRSSSSFCLLSEELNPNYEVIIENIVLRACKVRSNPAIIYGHAEALQKMNAKYPYDKSEIKVMSVPQGQLSVSWDNIFQGGRPNKIIMGLVSTQALSGSYSLNPYNFKNYDVRQITLLCDGVPVGGGPLKVNYSKNQGETIIPAYISLCLFV
ncbi:uncharacterized protein F54H12.2-like [Argopecten irradians]|uniref:uncharacterized protein F54H12.2-like n=1 Tax=Argopecten irradians TaxID=31199 RepID=UPI00371402F4